MRCLLEGQVSEFVEIPIPHGKVTIELQNANPNYAFFLRNFWKGLGKQVQLKFGNCHLGELGEKKKEENEEKEIYPLNPEWLTAMEDFVFYKTKSGRVAVIAKFIGRDTLPHTIRMNRATQNALSQSLLRELKALL